MSFMHVGEERARDRARNVPITSAGRYRHAVLLILTLFLAACDRYSDIGSGYEIFDGGGSKQSLTKDRLVLINYTVTGTGEIGDFVVVESREHRAPHCDYYVIDLNTRAMVPLIAGAPPATPISYRAGVEAVSPINRHSCRG